MPDTITMTRQTSLRGGDLQNTVDTMIYNISNTTAGRILNITRRWESSTRMVLTSPEHVSGEINIRDGSPSTVSVQLNLLSDLARRNRSTAERIMREEAQRSLPAPGTTATRETAQATAADETRTERTHRDIDWSRVGTVFSDILGTATSSLDAFNQAMGYSVSRQAVQIATETAKGAQTGPGFILGPGKVVEPGAPAPGPTVVNGSSQQDLTTTSQQRFPTVGWVVLGLGGVGLVAFTAWAMSKSKRSPRRNPVPVDKDRIDNIIYDFDLSHHDLVYLAADFAKHVLPIFENKYPRDPRPRDAIEAAQNYVNKRIDLYTLRMMRKNAMEVVRREFDPQLSDVDWRNVEVSAATNAAEAAVGVIDVATKGSTDAAKSSIESVAYHAWQAASDNMSPMTKRDSDAVIKKEQSWQVKRFFDCMEASRSGKPWPPLSGTKNTWNK